MKVLAHPFEEQTVEKSSILTHVTNPFYEHNIKLEHQDVIKQLAKTFEQIAITRVLTGVQRDNEAFSYWQGAATALKLCGMWSLSEDVAKLGALEISTRGYQAILELRL